MSSKKSARLLYLIPLIVGGVFAALGLLGATSSLDLKLYDAFLKLKPAVKENPSLVLLDIDEPSIGSVGAWPWPRGLVAKGMEALAEFKASYAVFDIEYIERSPASVDREYLKGSLKSDFDGFFDEAGSNIGELFGALQSGNIKLSDAREYGNQLVDLLKQGKSDLYSKTERVAVENDSYLGRAMRLFGSAYVTINLQPERMTIGGPSKEQRAIAESRFSYPKVEVLAPVGTKDKDFLVPIMEVSSMAYCAGFTNVYIDPDGVRRRIRLVEEIDGKRYLQLAFSPLMRWLGNPGIVVEKSRILLKGASLGGKTSDISIPLDAEGRMLLRWPKKTYDASFSHVSFYKLLEYLTNTERLVSNLRSLRSIEAWSLIAGTNPVDAPIAAWTLESDLRRAALESGTAEDRAAWLTAKVEAKAATAAFVSAGWDQRVAAALAKARSSAKSADKVLYDSIQARFSSLHGNCVDAVHKIDEQGRELQAKLAGAFCVIGWTATATTDMGANPFNKSYVNVGTHAAVANTILQQDFIAPVPAWVGALAAFAFSLLVVLLISRLEIAFRIAAGIFGTAAVLGGSYGIFALTGTYIPTLTPALATFVSFLVYTLVSFLISEREKSFLRRAFGTYLSGDIINQIIADPDKLSLGGQKMWITAMFTDVKGFSTISEALSPEALVTLLNLYLTGMSDIILENRGTIDKYEGDAIISFYGAPIHYEGHAHATVLSAVRMKKKEAEMNVKFLQDKLTPNPLLTRIGLNTGDIVVGNMGTEKKMNYTMMGNAVNLAARLEGVNKQYGTWILASDSTKQEAGDDFVTRRLDRVRVVGINTPVQLWEIPDLVAEADPAFLDFLDRFETAHQVFDSRDWKRAIELFAALAEERPGDGPTATYRKRAENFLKNDPGKDWDGVFSLNEK